jgi:hypothetical protein
MALKYIEYKGKKILIVDYTTCKSKDEMIQVLDQLAQECKKTSDKYRLLTDLTGQKPGSVFIKKVYEYSTVIEPKIIKKAIVGITGERKIILNGINAFFEDKHVLFNSREEAYEYLVS